MPTVAEKVKAFRALHQPGAAFIMPNPWDAGSARILQGLGFTALATTSAGFALTLGRRDYGVSREEAINHARDIAAAVDIPVSADLENGFGLSPEDAAETIRLASQTGLAGGSIEDSSGDKAKPIIERALAVERIAAAAEAARASKDGFVLTARAESFLYGETNLDDVIGRLKAYEQAGADVLFAPGLPSMEAVKEVCRALTKPLNVLALFSLLDHPISDYAEAGVARISTGSGIAWSAYGAIIDIGRTLEAGRFDCLKGKPAHAGKIGPHLR